jgi:hypothetical protein
MKKTRIAQLLIAMILIATTIISCSKQEPTPDPVKITRLDQIVSRYNSHDTTARIDTFKRYESQLTGLLQIVGFDSINARTVSLWANMLPVQIFSPAIDSIFTDIAPIEQSLGYILANARQRGLSIPNYTYNAVAWGRDKSIIINDKNFYIALNHYLGQHHEAYHGWPEYKRVMKNQEMIPYDMAEALVATAYPYKPKNTPSVYSRLLYDGAIIYIKTQLVHDADTRLALGFTLRQMDEIQQNVTRIWNTISADNGRMLYSTDPVLIGDLLNPRPYSTPLSKAAPNRAARIVGLGIIQAYLDHNPDTPLADLLSPDFYDNRSTLVQAQYSPVK